MIIYDDKSSLYAHAMPRNSFAQRQPTHSFLHIVSERDTILRGKYSAILKVAIGFYAHCLSLSI